jgi:hypothetical protein
MSLEKEIQKIKSYKTWTKKRKVDTLLEIDANAYTNLGTDSTKKEREITRKNSRKIYRAISEISPLDGYILERHMIEKDLRDVKIPK